MVWTMTTARVFRNQVTMTEILTSSIEANVDQILQNLTQQAIALPVTTHQSNQHSHHKEYYHHPLSHHHVSLHLREGLLTVVPAVIFYKVIRGLPYPKHFGKSVVFALLSSVLENT